MTVAEASQFGNTANWEGASITGMSILNGSAIRKIALIALSVVFVTVRAQSTKAEDTLAKDTQARGYWSDPGTKLTWAARDNGRNVNWHQAGNYCRKLRVAGYADWRLPTIDELEELIDMKAFAPEHVGDSSILHFNFDRKVHGGLLLTGHEWSSSQRLDDRGKPAGIAWWFDFVNVRRSDDSNDVGLLDNYDKRALCVRDSGPATDGAMATPSGAQVAATFSDPATGLIWAVRDNGKNVNLGEAMKYCHDLRLDGYSGWRLATIEELEGIQALDAGGREDARKQNGQTSIDRGGGMLLLTGDSWSSSPVTKDGDNRWYLSMKSGTRVFDDPSFSRVRRAVCVHEPLARQPGRPGALGSSRGEQGTQERGYWIDPATSLMWAARDSLGGSHFYRDGTNYCHEIRLAGHTDWRLPTKDEMTVIYDPNAESPGAVPRSNWQAPEADSFHAKGNLFLTGVEWVSISDNDDGNPSHYRLVFDFKNGKAVQEKRWFVEARALCVRGPGA